MKIGILTFHFAHNYGAMLQAYALNTFLNKVGYESFIIDYRLPFIYTRFENWPFWEYVKKRSDNNIFIIALLKAVKFKILRLSDFQYQRYEFFLNRLQKKTNRVFSLSEINSLGFDAIVVGSDQIWNDALTGKLEGIYFCEGVTSPLKISYAASNGKNSAGSAIVQFKKLLNNLNEISVREKSLCSDLTSIGIKCQCVIDPVFLLNINDWTQLINKQPVYKDYILVYSFDETEAFFPVVNYISERMKKKVVYLCYWKLDNISSKIKQLSNNGPLEFLQLFSNASFVITNSFHGTAFSIIFEKQFITMAPKKGIDRIIDLLTLLDLSDRMINDPKDFDNIGRIDFNRTKEVLNEEVGYSKNFIINSLQTKC